MLSMCLALTEISACNFAVQWAEAKGFGYNYLKVIEGICHLGISLEVQSHDHVNREFVVNPEDGSKGRQECNLRMIYS